MDISLDLLFRLNGAISSYIDIFTEKHKLEFSFWVGDKVGEVCCLSDFYFVDFNDIRLDLEEPAKKGLFFKWYDKNLEQLELERPPISYKSFIMEYN